MQSPERLDAQRARAPIIPPAANPHASYLSPFLVGGTSPVSDERLRRLEQLASLGALSASCSHEIRNALVAVRTFIDLLGEQQQDGSMAEMARREICRIDGLLGQMLQLSSERSPSVKSISLHELLGQLVRVIEPKCKENGLVISASLEAVSDQVPADISQLQQAFLNLVLNAVEAVSHGGEIRVRSTVYQPRAGAAKNNGPSLHVAVSDNGQGISPQNLPKIFEPFFTTKANGTGLGLAITRQIIEQHGGTITVESDLGKGTTFHVLLPLHTRSRAAA